METDSLEVDICGKSNDAVKSWYSPCWFLVLYIYVVRTLVGVFAGVPKSGHCNVSVKIASPVEWFGDVPSPTLHVFMDTNWRSEFSLLLFLSNFVVRPTFFDFGHLYCLGQEDDVTGNVHSALRILLTSDGIWLRR